MMPSSSPPSSASSSPVFLPSAAGTAAEAAAPLLRSPRPRPALEEELLAPTRILELLSRVLGTRGAGADAGAGAAADAAGAAAGAAAAEDDDDDDDDDDEGGIASLVNDKYSIIRSFTSISSTSATPNCRRRSTSSPSLQENGSSEESAMIARLPCLMHHGELLLPRYTFCALLAMGGGRGTVQS